MKKFASILLAAALTFTLASCTGAGEKPSQPLSIGILPDVDSIPLVIAKQNGYFEEEGLNINIEHFQSPVDRDVALQTGKIDGAVSDILAAAFAKEGGFDVKITSMTDGSYKLLVGKNSGIKSFGDLAGKSVAISRNTIIEYSTDMMLKEAGLTPDDIKKEVIPKIPLRLEALKNGQIDAATLPEPLASAAIKSGAALLNSSDKLGINPGILMFTAKSVSSKSAEIQAFYRAYNKAANYLEKEDKSKYIDVLVKEAGFPEEVKETITLPEYTKAGLPSEKDFNNVIAWLASKDLIRNTYKFNELVDNSFVR